LELVTAMMLSLAPVAAIPRRRRPGAVGRYRRRRLHISAAD